ncbi:LuxR C-terminal-related transcriptional regulator [Mycobacterium sp. SP-6446]|uniref:LuxR C-terminal-related transcriptional regulator n=1 Tax=Mycobacterium sp. SP-6446 TaxID=1834162 RepID=UPI00096D112A|nr:LuxR C-terminal-related transcriptional regulator [Mycobacterium sp. SP-6446]OMC13548.1 hypothetical protein A5736_23140 [Mycobacterium sp. SP-6446]
MDIQIPAGLQWLAFLAGSRWPARPASESGMWRIGGYLSAAADGLEALIPALARTRAATQAVLSGQTARAADEQFHLLFDGEFAVAKLMGALRALADLASGNGTEIQYTKLEIISTLGITAESIWRAVVAFPWNPAASVALTTATEEVAAQSIGELVSMVLSRIQAALVGALDTTTVSRLVIEGAIAAGIGTGQELGIEAIQLGEGRREGIDVGQVMDSAVSMGLAGMAAGAVGPVVKEMVGSADHLGMQVVKGAVSGVSSATAANLVGTAVGGGDVTAMTFFGGAIGLVDGGARGGASHAGSVHRPADGRVPVGAPFASDIERASGVEPGAAAGAAAASAGHEHVSASTAAAPPATHPDPVARASDSAGPPEARAAVSEQTAVGGKAETQDARSHLETPAAANPGDGHGNQIMADTGHAERAPGDSGIAKSANNLPTSAPRFSPEEHRIGGGGDPRDTRQVVPAHASDVAPPAPRAAFDHGAKAAVPSPDGRAVAGPVANLTAESLRVAAAHAAETTLAEAGMPADRAGGDPVAGRHVGPPTDAAGTDRTALVRDEGGARSVQGAGSLGRDARVVAVRTDSTRPHSGRSDGARPGAHGPDRLRRSAVSPDMRGRLGRVTRRVNGAPTDVDDPLRAAKAVGLVAGSDHLTVRDAAGSYGGGGHAEGFAEQPSPDRRNCVVASGDQLTQWYELDGRDYRVYAEPDPRGIPAVVMFETTNSAADFVETFDAVKGGFADLPVGSSAIVAVKWRWSAWAKFVNWLKTGSLDGGHMFLARKVGPDEIRFVDPKTGEDSLWPPPYGESAVQRMVVGYLDDTGQAVKPLHDKPADIAPARRLGRVAGDTYYNDPYEGDAEREYWKAEIRKADRFADEWHQAHLAKDPVLLEQSMDAIDVLIVHNELTARDANGALKNWEKFKGQAQIQDWELYLDRPDEEVTTGVGVVAHFLKGYYGVPSRDLGGGGPLGTGGQDRNTGRSRSSDDPPGPGAWVRDRDGTWRPGRLPDDFRPPKPEPNTSGGRATDKPAADSGDARNRPDAGDKPRDRPKDAGPPQGPHLSPREREVLALVAERLTDQQIADRLSLGLRTISTHVEHSLRKLGVGDRIEAALLAHRLGLINLPAHVLEALERGQLLTPREQEVLPLVVAGLSDKEIADRLVVSARTAEVFVGRLLRKLGVKSRTALGRAARQRGIGGTGSQADGPPSLQSAPTPRERDVLALVAAGRTNKQIARELRIAQRTVEFHVEHLLMKLEAKNRTELAALARQRGLVD